jgi:hypothetical protein
MKEQTTTPDEHQQTSSSHHPVPGLSQWVAEVGKYHRSIVDVANWPPELTKTVKLDGDDGSMFTQTTFHLQPGDDENKVVVYIRHYHERYGAALKDVGISCAVGLHQHSQEPALFGGFDDAPESQQQFHQTVVDALDVIREQMTAKRQQIATRRAKLHASIATARHYVEDRQHIADLLEVHDLYLTLRAKGVHCVELVRDDHPHYHIAHIESDRIQPDLHDLEDMEYKIIESGIPWQALRRADVSGNTDEEVVVLDVTSDPGGVCRAELESSLLTITSDHTLDHEALYTLNDQLTAALASMGWVADSEDDYERLNELTHQVAGLVEGFQAEGKSFPSKMQRS